MKRPSLQFYPADWRNNAKLRRCTFTERGIWLEVLCLFHDSDDYGILRWPLKDVAQAIGCKLAELRSIAAKGVIKGSDSKTEPFTYVPRHAGKDGKPVLLIPEQDGPLWFSSRMVRDEYIRSKRGEGTRFGDEPKPAPNPPFGSAPKPPPIQREGDGPSSSSSSSSSSSVAKSSASGENENFTPAPAVALAVELRRRGLKVNGAHPTLQAWCTDGFSLPSVVEALELARQRKPEPEDIPVNYLDAILRNPPKKAEPAWWSSDQRILAKGRELGLEARPGEEMSQFKERIQSEMAKRKVAA